MTSSITVLKNDGIAPGPLLYYSNPLQQGASDIATLFDISNQQEQHELFTQHNGTNIMVSSMVSWISESKIYF
jgi:hypothetical protein